VQVEHQITKVLIQYFLLSPLLVVVWVVTQQMLELVEPHSEAVLVAQVVVLVMQTYLAVLVTKVDLVQ
jgi:hypothetical protein